MSLPKLWGSVLISISFCAWSLTIKKMSDKPRLPMQQTALTIALSAVVLYIFPAVGFLLLTWPE